MGATAAPGRTAQTHRREAEVRPAVAGHARARLAGVLLTIVLVAAGLRMPGIASMPLWIDEWFTLGQARGGWPDLLELQDTAHPPGYRLLAHITRGATPEGWGVRIPALCGGLLGVAVAFLGARSIGFATVAPFAGLWIACSVYHIYYSQEARGYTWMSALSALTVFLAARQIRRPDGRTLAGAILAGVAACGFHYLALPTVLAAAAVVAGHSLARRARVDLRASEGRSRLALGAGFLVGACAALLLSRSLVGFLGRRFLAATTAIDIGPRFVSNVLGRWSGLGSGAGWFVTACSAIGLVSCLKKSRATGVLLLCTTAAPFLAIAWVPWPHRFEMRYLMAAAIPVTVLAVAGASVLLEAMGAALSRLRGRDSRTGIQLTSLGLIVVPGLQLFAAWGHLSAPRKHHPAVFAGEFACRHLLFHSLLEPWMVRNLEAGDCLARERIISSLVIPLPDWTSGERSRRGGITYSNPMANEKLIIEVLPTHPGDHWSVLSKEGTIRTRRDRDGVTSLLSFARHPISGEKIGRLQLVGVCSPPDVKFRIEIISSRIAFFQGYLGRVANTVRWNPGLRATPASSPR